MGGGVSFINGSIAKPDATTGLVKIPNRGYANQNIVYNPNTQQQGYMAGGKFYPINATPNNQYGGNYTPVNYTPSQSLQQQLEQANQMFNQPLPQRQLRVAPQAGSK